MAASSSELQATASPLSTVSAMPAKKRRSSTAPPKRAAASVPTFDPSDPMGQLRAFLEAAGADAAGARALGAAEQRAVDALLAELADGAESAYGSTNLSFISQNVELMNFFDEVLAHFSKMSA